jgi:hypothetical protein
MSKKDLAEFVVTSLTHLTYEGRQRNAILYMCRNGLENPGWVQRQHLENIRDMERKRGIPESQQFRLEDYVFDCHKYKTSRRLMETEEIVIDGMCKHKTTEEDELPRYYRKIWKGIRKNERLRNIDPELRFDHNQWMHKCELDRKCCRWDYQEGYEGDTLDLVMIAETEPPPVSATQTTIFDPLQGSQCSKDDYECNTLAKLYPLQTEPVPAPLLLNPPNTPEPPSKPKHVHIATRQERLMKLAGRRAKLMVNRKNKKTKNKRTFCN